MSFLENILFKLGLAKPKNRRIARKGQGPKQKSESLLLLPAAIILGMAIGISFVVAVVHLIRKTPDDVTPVSQAAQLDADAATNEHVTSGKIAPQKSPAKHKTASIEKFPANTEVSKPKPEQEPQKSARADVHKAVMLWAKAWSRRDVSSYLECYAGDFNVPQGLSRTAWESQRKSRISRPQSIKITLQNIKIDISGEDAANVRFVQHYRADRHFSRGTGKELGLKKEHGRWLIVSEKVF